MNNSSALGYCGLVRNQNKTPSGKMLSFWTLNDGQIGGASRDRTDDPLLAKQVLSQLSYGPLKIWWVWEDLNLRPHPYQGCALTN